MLVPRLKNFFMLNSDEHEFCPANKSQISSNCKFSLAEHELSSASKYRQNTNKTYKVHDMKEKEKIPTSLLLKRDICFLSPVSAICPYICFVYFVSHISAFCPCICLVSHACASCPMYLLSVPCICFVSHVSALCPMNLLCVPCICFVPIFLDMVNISNW